MMGGIETPAMRVRCLDCGKHLLEIRGKRVKMLADFLNQQNKKDEPVNSGNSAITEAFAKFNLKK